VTSLPGTLSAVAIALFQGQLFVTRFPVAQLFVYDTAFFQLLQQITIPGIDNSLGSATSAIDNSLYIVTGFNCVKRVDLLATNNVNTVECDLSAFYYGLSVTSTGNILVVNRNTISEYTPGGSLVRSVTDSNYIWQAVEVKNGVWVFSRKGPVHGIAMVSTNGTVIKSFGSTAGSGITQMNDPRSLVIDSHGYIIVADHGNNRILVVDPTFTVARQLLLPVNTSLQAPIALSLDQDKSRLYVGEDAGQYRVLVLSYT